MRALAGALPLALLWGLPLLLGFGAALTPLADAAAWQALVAHPQLWPALALSLWTGIASTVVALVLALWIVPALIGRGLERFPAWMLALPHLSFAIGFGFLIMPAGFLTRLLALVTGWDTPPAIVTNHDPVGLSLIAVLALKEAPFLLWAAVTMLARPGLLAQWNREAAAAASLGHGSLSVWTRVLYPQLLDRMLWPIVIVWVYGATVIDAAAAIGPTAPPTLGLVIWRDLNDVDAAVNARGEAGALFLTVVLGVGGGAVALMLRALRRPWRRMLARGPALKPWSLRGSLAMFRMLTVVYAAVAMILAVMTFAGPWPFPKLLPLSFSPAVALHLLYSHAPLTLSLGLGVAAALVALGLAVVWFETVDERRDRWLIAAAVAALAAPPVLIAAGQYTAFLPLGLTGTLAGLFLAHLTPVFAYVAIMLQGPYRAFDRRLATAAASLGHTPLEVWWQVKAPLLRPAMAAAAATGFAVSVGQFVAAQLMAAGRYSTLTMEAVTLTSGGSRPLLALYSFALALLPLLAFGLAAKAARPRWNS